MFSEENFDKPAGTVFFDGKKIYLRPATFDMSVQDDTKRLFEGYGVTPELLVPALGADIPQPLKDGFPMEDKEAFIYMFDPKPLDMDGPMEGELGILDAGKIKENFRKLHRKIVSLRELAMTFAISRQLGPNKQVRR